jgi:hypothetical protein
LYHVYSAKKRRDKLKHGDMEKIQRVYQHYVTTHKKGKTYKRGPYWRGSGTYNGIQYTIHIGKELPTELQKLLENRVERKGVKVYKWPGPVKKTT